MNDELSGWLARVGLDPARSRPRELLHNRWLTPGIWLIDAPSGRTVLKVLRRERAGGETPQDRHWTSGSDDPRRWNYWAREGLAYQHQVVGPTTPGSLVAPECLAADVVDGEIVLLLEHVEGTPAEAWGIAGYGTAAEALGRWQAPYLTGVQYPDFSWLSLRFLREYSSEKAVDWGLLDDDDAWDLPLVRDNFPPELRGLASQLHENRDRLYAIAETLPRTLCHLDFWTKNLIRTNDGNVAVVDWAFVGDGAVGEDIGNLVPDAAFDHFIAPRDLGPLSRVVMNSYIRGLTAGGWSGDPRIVRLGMCASAVKYDWLTPAMLAAATAPRQMAYGGVDEMDPITRFRDRGAALLFNAERAQEALALAQDLGL